MSDNITIKYSFYISNSTIGAMLLLSKTQSHQCRHSDFKIPTIRNAMIINKINFFFFGKMWNHFSQFLCLSLFSFYSPNDIQSNEIFECLIEFQPIIIFPTYLHYMLIIWFQFVDYKWKESIHDEKNMLSKFQIDRPPYPQSWHFIKYDCLFVIIDFTVVVIVSFAWSTVGIVESLF